MRNKAHKYIAILSLIFVIINCLFFVACLGERKYEIYKYQCLRNGVVIEEYSFDNPPEEFEDFGITNLVLQINHKVRIDGGDFDEISWRETDTEIYLYNNYGSKLVLRKEGKFLILEQKIDGDLYQLHYKRV